MDHPWTRMGAWLLLVLLTSSVTCLRFPEYSEISGLRSCAPLDTCSGQKTRQLEDLRTRNCACDHLCAEYGDCCANARNRGGVGSASYGHGFWQCRVLRQFGGVFLRKSCAPGWEGATAIRQLCERGAVADDAPLDPLGALPTSSMSTGVTYSNYFCAVCNDDSNNLVLWQPRVECPSLGTYNRTYRNLTEGRVKDALVFDAGATSWGVWVWQGGKRLFHNCTIDPIVPDVLLYNGAARPCRHNLVSRCPPEWEDVDVAEKCASYMAGVYWRQQGFRNPHCALCHGVNASELSCMALEGRGGVADASFNFHAFALLLDVNDHQGAVVGTVVMCREGEVFDPFFRRCRNIVCGFAGYQYRAGRCMLVNRHKVPSFATIPTTATTTTTTTTTRAPTTTEVPTTTSLPTTTEMPETTTVIITTTEASPETTQLPEVTTTEEPLPTTTPTPLPTVSIVPTISEVTTNVAEPEMNATDPAGVFPIDGDVIEIIELNDTRGPMLEDAEQFETNSVSDVVGMLDYSQSNDSVAARGEEATDETTESPTTVNPWIEDPTINYDIVSLPSVPKTPPIFPPPPPPPIATNSLLPREALAEEVNTQNFSEEFLQCPKITVDPGDYLVAKNGSIYIPAYSKLYKPGQFLFHGETLLVCIHFATNTTTFKSKFSIYMGYVSTIGLGLSIMCLFLHALVFVLVPELQNLSGRNLVSLSSSLLVAYCCFILGQLGFLTQAMCTAVAILMFYAFLGSFFWMNVLAFDVWRTLRMATKELRVSTGAQWKRFLLYSTYAWLSPLVLVGMAVGSESITSLPKEFKPSFGVHHCWFGNRKALLIFFATPLASIMIANILLFTGSARMIVQTTRSSVKYQCSASRSHFRLYFKLAIIMGLTWLAGLIASYAELEFLWYIFVFFNTLQGLFIFVAFSCNKKALAHLGAKLAKIRKGLLTRRSSSVNSGFNSQSTVASNTGGRLASPPKNKDVTVTAQCGETRSPLQCKFIRYSKQAKVPNAFY